MRPGYLFRPFLYVFCPLALAFAPAIQAESYVSLYDKLAGRVPDLGKEALKSALLATQCNHKTASLPGAEGRDNEG